mmetsp:Transcript_10514/g.19248  ORF Transcript_10514/g.19248 Transcript_10514/m.19248 type:complete len:194 (+) Transcript_10514:65-646(+)
MFVFAWGTYKNVTLHPDQTLLQFKRCSNPRCFSPRVALLQQTSTCHFCWIPLIRTGKALLVKCLNCQRLVSQAVHERQGQLISGEIKKVQMKRQKERQRSLTKSGAGVVETPDPLSPPAPPNTDQTLSISSAAPVTAKAILIDSQGKTAFHEALPSDEPDDNEDEITSSLSTATEIISEVQLHEERDESKSLV